MVASKERHYVAMEDLDIRKEMKGGPREEPAQYGNKEQGLP